MNPDLHDKRLVGRIAMALIAVFAGTTFGVFLILSAVAALTR